MPINLSRRELLQRTALAGGLAALGGVWTEPAGAQNPAKGDKLRIASIGVGGQGHGDIGNFRDEVIVALCDVDDARAAGAYRDFPNARRYKDYRVMLEKEAKNIDAVSVSTPDHSHAPASVMAMKLGKHVYCQKPLTHCVQEARVMMEVARRHRVVTQMGTQAHPSYARLVEYVQAGVIGPIREVHVWTDRPAGWWPQGIEAPKDTQPVPTTLDWDLWLGPAPWRAYNAAYMPFVWRGWWDFGTGALGDMACHLMDGAFWSLKLGYPTAVWTEGEPLLKDSAPSWQTVHYEFPARGDMPAVKMTWWDAGKKPPTELFEGKDPGSVSNGSLFIGDKGKMLVNHGNDPVLLPEATFKDFVPPAITLPRSPGHYIEWINACKTGGTTASNFDYAAVMTESVLLGNVAFRVGKRIEWDAKRMRATNAPEADQYVRYRYRKGWRL